MGVGTDLSKAPPILSHDERVEVLKKQTASYDNIDVQTFSGLTVDFAKQLGATTLIRGLRNGGDLNSEMEMAAANHRLGIETFFLIADPKSTQISSSLIRQLAAWGAPLKDYIPEELELLLHSRLKKS
jgi:pantetheine-phosphate adenylyltransferase